MVRIPMVRNRRQKEWARVSTDTKIPHKISWNPNICIDMNYAALEILSRSKTLP